MSMKRTGKLYHRLKRAGCTSLGDFERLAGLAQDAKTRQKFWRKYEHKDTQTMFDAGLEVLMRRIARRLHNQQLTLIARENGQYQPV